MSRYLERVWKTLLGDDYYIIAVFTILPGNDNSSNKQYNVISEAIKFLDDTYGKKFKMTLNEDDYKDTLVWKIGPIPKLDLAKKVKSSITQFLLDNKIEGVEFSVTMQ